MMMKLDLCLFLGFGLGCFSGAFSPVSLHSSRPCLLRSVKVPAEEMEKKEEEIRELQRKVMELTMTTVMAKELATIRADFTKEIQEKNEILFVRFTGLVKAEIAEVKAEIAEVKAEIKADIKEVRAEIKEVRAEIKEVRAEIKAVKGELTTLTGEFRKETIAARDRFTAVYVFLAALATLGGMFTFKDLAPLLK